MDLQCSKWHIGLKMDNLLFQTPILTSILAHIALENGYKYKIWLSKYILYIALHTRVLTQFMYEVTSHHMQNWPQKVAKKFKNPYFGYNGPPLRGNCTA